MTEPVKAPKGRILVVDDEPGLARAVAKLLNHAGFITETADNGVAAMERLDGEPFDALISDIAMPGLDGIGLLRQVRERDAELPVLLMTGSPSIDTAARAVELGALRYLTKPVDPEELVKCVEGAVRLKRLAQAKREALDLLAQGGLGIADRTTMTVRFDSAITKLWMAYQPIVSWSKKTVYGYEALVRCHEETLPHPGALFDAAERLGRVHELGIAIRELATAGFADAPPHALLFVNLHMLDLNEVSLYLPTSKLSGIANRVVLEITERASFDHVKNIRARAAVLRQLGFRIAIDDLGAGYAGLSSFAMLEPDIVKIDMSLVRDIHREPVKQRIVRSLTSLCHESGLIVVAEGIETVEERDIVAQCGCDLMQGFLFARPEKPFPEVKW
ncbi:MAG: EAL domain-containing protein [Polyangia bacterium]